MGPLKRPRIKYIGQLARWQILALNPLFFRFPIPQVCPPLEVTPLNEATDPDDMSMVEAVVFISVMLSENTCQQSWSWSFWFEENLFHQSLDCVQASLYPLISSPVGSASSIAQFITNTTWFCILLPPSYSIGKIKTTTSSTILPTKVYNCRTWHHSYSTPSCMGLSSNIGTCLDHQSSVSRDRRRQGRARIHPCPGFGMVWGKLFGI